MFYDKFVSLCKSKGVSRTKACTDCGVSRTAWHKWENGAIPNGATINKFADYFGISVSLLLGNQKEQPHVPEDIGPNKQKILNSVPDLTEAEAALLLERIEKIKESRV